jgi:hypothetical protein
MTRGATTVVPGEDGCPADGQHAFFPKMFCDGVADHYFRTVQFHGWKKFAVGQVREPEGLTGDPNELFNVVVPGRQICVPDGPVDRNAFAKIGFEIEITPAVDLAAPHDRTSANLAATNLSEWLFRSGCIGIFFVADKKLCRPLITRVARALDRLIFSLPAAIAHTSESHLPRWNVFDIILLGDNRSSSLKH